MQRNVYLQGELGDKFGSKFVVAGNTYKDIFKCIEANRPEFKSFLLDCHEKDIGFTVECQGTLVDADALLLPIKEGDVTVSIIPAGSKSGVGKILAAIAIIALIVFTPFGGSFATAVGPGGAAMGGLTAAGTAATTLAINLALSGIQQMMAPDPSVDQDSPENYAFNGNAQNIVEGDPIPLLYGELRVPGRPVSVETTIGSFRNQGGIPSYAGSYTGTGTDQTSPPATQQR
tara:strand:+ start:887 stop:1579 length:693 start_codon:yes stop_codon:yes gene_type:complete